MLGNTKAPPHPSDDNAMPYATVDIKRRIGTCSFELGECITIDATAEFEGDEYIYDSLFVSTQDGDEFHCSDVMIRPFGATNHEYLRDTLIGLCRESAE